MELDGLFSVRNFFWLGNFEAALDEADGVSPKGDRETIDLEVFRYRCLIGQGKADQVINKVGRDAGTDVQAVKLFAQYVAHEAQREAVLGTLAEWLNDDMSRNNQMLQLMAGLTFFRHGDTKEALKSLRSPENLEQVALKVQILLSLNRIDLARHEVAAMERLDDDCTLTQLAQAQCHLASGDAEKYQEAAYIFKDQMEKSVSSPMLLNGMAVANMQMKRFDEAEKYLQEAYAKDPSNPDILINLISCSANLCKPTNELLGKLAAVHPGAPVLSQLKSCLATFDKVAAAKASA